MRTFDRDRELATEQSWIAQLETTLLDVGHGACVVIEAKRSTTVVDCAHVGTLARFLSSRGLSRVHNVVVSHLDRDHFEGITALLRTFSIRIDTLFLNAETCVVAGKPNRHDARLIQDFWDAVVERTKNHRMAVAPAPEGGHVSIDDGVELCFLWPAHVHTIAPATSLKALTGGAATTNALSVVASLEVNGWPDLVLTADAEVGALRSLVASATGAGWNQVPVVQMPHHGGKVDADEAVSNDMLEEVMSALTPQIVVVQNGRYQYDNPRVGSARAVLLGSGNVNLVCTQLNKNCCAAHTDGGFPLHPKCAGNVHILHDVATVRTEREDHPGFVDGLRSPRCR